MSENKLSNSKFTSEDLNGLINGSEYLKTSLGKKKPLKGQRRDKKIGHKLIGQTNLEEKKINTITEARKEARQKLINAMSHQLNISVEGLLTRGAMKSDDRPLWFDVYRAFPPDVEPKYARPKPEIKEIRPILYKEDVLRAKFHSKGHGLGAVNMQSATETQTKKLIKQYEKLKSEGVLEEELIEKSAMAVGSERQLQSPKEVSRNPASLTSQILAEANLENIFNEKENK